MFVLATIIALIVPPGALANALANTGLPDPWTSLGILYGLIVSSTGILLILDHNRPTKTLAWLLVILFIPVLGLILYLFFGLNYRKRRRFGNYPPPAAPSSTKELADFPSIPACSDADRQFCQSIYQLLYKNSGAVLRGGNQVQILTSGKAKQEALLQDLESAKEYIHLCYYIFENGRWAEQIAQRLKKKAQEGLDVRLLFDDVGSWDLSSQFLQE